MQYLLDILSYRVTSQNRLPPSVSLVAFGTLLPVRATNGKFDSFRSGSVRCLACRRHVVTPRHEPTPSCRRPARKADNSSASEEVPACYETRMFTTVLKSFIPCSLLNLLKHTGHVMHHQFNIQQLYALPTLYLCVLYLSENKHRLVPLTA